MTAGVAIPSSATSPQDHVSSAASGVALVRAGEPHLASFTSSASAPVLAGVSLSAFAAAPEVVADAKAKHAAEVKAAKAAKAKAEKAKADKAKAAKVKAAKAAKAKRAAKAKAEKSADARSTNAPASRGHARTSGSPREIGRSLASARGWGGRQFACLDKLWNKESNWVPTADNPTSSAYGIPQALPGRKMASAGADWRTNPATQIRWGLDYIADVYGSPCAAWSHSQRVNWY